MGKNGVKKIHILLFDGIMRREALENLVMTRNSGRIGRERLREMIRDGVRQWYGGIFLELIKRNDAGCCLRQ